MGRTVPIEHPMMETPKGYLEKGMLVECHYMTKSDSRQWVGGRIYHFEDLESDSGEDGIGVVFADVDDGERLIQVQTHTDEVFSLTKKQRTRLGRLLKLRVVANPDEKLDEATERMVDGYGIEGL